MKKEVLISIEGNQSNGADTDKIELMTTGLFYQKPNAFYLCYDESEATGFAGSHTTLKIEGNRRVTMTRTGAVKRSQLVVEQGKRHLSHYDTGYGEMIIAVFGEEISSNLTEQGGKLSFRYTLDINAGFASKNQVNISITPKQ